eukprot:3122655-Lingulodinium_polyedra.AAC.1
MATRRLGPSGFGKPRRRAAAERGARLRGRSRGEDGPLLVVGARGRPSSRGPRTPGGDGLGRPRSIGR